MRGEGNGGWRRRGNGTGDAGHRHAWEPGVGDGAGEHTERVKDGEPMRRRWELPEALQCLTAEQRVSAATIFQNMFAFIVRGSFYIL